MRSRILKTRNNIKLKQHSFYIVGVERLTDCICYEEAVQGAINKLIGCRLLTESGHCHFEQ